MLFLYMLPLVDRLRTLDWRGIGKMMKEMENVLI